MRDTKEFPTLIVASAVTGIGLCRGTFSDMMEITSWLCGFDIFTHELAHAPTYDIACDEAYRQYPLLPAPADAETDWKAAADKAINTYGSTLSVRRGSAKRRESPIDTLTAMKPDASILVIDPRSWPKDEGKP